MRPRNSLKELLNSHARHLPLSLHCEQYGTADSPRGGCSCPDPGNPRQQSRRATQRSRTPARTSSEERTATADLERQVAVDEAILQGLNNNDPYTIELMARRKLGMKRDGDIIAPELASEP